MQKVILKIARKIKMKSKHYNFNYSSRTQFHVKQKPDTRNFSVSQNALHQMRNSGDTRSTF